MYALWDGSGWVTQTVYTGSYFTGPSLALGAAGKPHISYVDYLRWDLSYARRDGSSWLIETVDSGGAGTEPTSLALDASGYARISYTGASGSGNDLKYAAWNGSSWDIERVDSAGDVGWYTSLALDASAYPHISYLDGVPDYDLKYAAWNGSSWDIQTVDSAGDVGWDTSLALDASGYAQISYRNSQYGDPKYAAWTGSSWDIETVDSRDCVGSYTSLALDASGHAHISYYDSTNGQLKYATTHAPAQAWHQLSTTGYYMISFPLIPPSPTPDALLSDDLGDGGYYMWRWEAGGYQTVPTSAPASQTTTLDIQEGFWLLAQAATLDVDVGGTLPHGDQALPLQPGWNMVAAPYEAAMDSLLVGRAGEVRSLAEAQSAAWVLATFYYSHDGTGSYSTLTIDQTPPDRLCLWHGYWVLAGIDCSLIVPVAPPSPPTATTAAVRGLACPAWAFDIQASSGSSGDSITIAAADTASDEFDGFALDKPKPPGPPGEGRVRMVLREGWRGTRASQRLVLRSEESLLRRVASPASQSSTEPPPYNKAPGRQMPWSSELAMETKGTGQEGLEWDFILTGGVEGDTVTLSWPELSRLPKDRVAILTDRDTGQRSFMRTRAQCEFAAPGAGTTRNFSLTVKRVEDGALLISGLTATPTRGGAWDIGFNLSADAAVTARVYNVAGRRVSDIARSEQLARGRAALTWNARSLTGTAVPSGTYVLWVTARTEDGEEASAVALVPVRR